MKCLLLSQLLLLVFCSASVLAQDKFVTVTAKQANVREIPSQKSRIVGKVYKDNMLSVSANSGEWYYIVYKKVRGWIHYSTIKVVDFSALDKLAEDTLAEKNKPKEDALEEYIKSQWLYITSSTAEKYYYSTTRKHSSAPYIYAWIKVSSSEPNNYFSERAAYDSDKEDLRSRTNNDHIDYFLEYWQINCAIKFSKVLTTYAVWAKGGMQDFTIRGWQSPLSPVVPETVDEAIANKICEVSK